jgi:hypothetical protein
MAVDLTLEIDAKHALNRLVELGVEFRLILKHLLGAPEILAQPPDVARHNYRSGTENHHPYQVVGLELAVGDGEHYVCVHVFIVQGSSFQRKVAA